MKPHFVFPASPLNPRMIDEEFQDQAIALKQAGFNTAVVNLEEKRLYGTPALGDDPVVYRGWMLSESEYDALTETITASGGKLLVGKAQYYATHYLPNWYSLVEDLTVNSAVFPKDKPMFERGLKAAAVLLTEFVRTMQAAKLPPFNADNGLPWDKFQLKDYVKSLKTDGGSTTTSPDEILPIMEKMEKYRGTIEGGIVIRQWEEFHPGSEKRYFVVNGRIFAQNHFFDNRAYDILERVARDRHIDSPFYSVDIAQRSSDSHFRIVEIGDGQVSDLVGWTPERFAEIWK